jgi:hypothetical protein
MLTKDFLCKREVLGKRSHTHSPPPLSVVGVSNSWNTRRKSMKRNSYSMTRRRNGVRKGDIFEKIEAQSSSSEKQGHLQKWVKKTEQPEHNGSLKGISSVSSSEAYAGYRGNSRVHMQHDLE